MALKLLLQSCSRYQLRPWSTAYLPTRRNSQHRIVLLPEVPDDTNKTNPILKKITDGFPDYNRIKERDVYYGLGRAVIEFEAAVSKLEQKCRDGERGFTNLFSGLEKAKCQFESVWNTANMLQLTADILERDRFHRLYLRAERSMLSLFDSDQIFKAFKEIKAKQVEDGNFLTADEERIVDCHLLEYRQRGHGLSEKKISELQGHALRQLNEAMSEYKFKIGVATERFKHTIRDPNVVKDFPVDVLKAMCSDSSQPTKGPWTVTLHPYIYKQVMAYCPDRNVRWTTHQADVTRGTQNVDSHTNVASHVKLIRRCRNDQALTLGYNNFVEMSMDSKMAMSMENVQVMINAMLGNAKIHQEMELEALQSYAETRGFDGDIQVCDVEFFKRKQRHSLLGVSDEDLRDFFPFPKILSGIFELFSSLFCLQFEEVMEKDPSFWHPDVRLFQVVDTSSGANRKIGEFYLDPYIRNDKDYEGGEKGWYVPIRGSSRIANCQPVGVMVLSFPAPNYGKPSLLNFAETQELLRNFGNLLFHMCSQASDWSNLNGKVGLEWDVLDLPGNFFANWMYTPEVLRLLSGHWSTNQPLDFELITKLSTVPRQLMAGYSLCQELYLAAYDIAFYADDPVKEYYRDMAARLRSEFLLLPAGEYEAFPLYATDMLSGDFPAAVYSSTWAKMIAADAFSAVQEVMPDSNSSLLTDEEVKKVTMRYRNTILGMGSSRTSAETFRLFRGRDPSHEALLLSLGLKGTSQSKKSSQEAVL